MTNGHDFCGAIRSICPGCNFKFIIERVRLDDQTVVASRNEWIGKIGEDALIVMMDRICFAMHQLFSTNNS